MLKTFWSDKCTKPETPHMLDETFCMLLVSFSGSSDTNMKRDLWVYHLSLQKQRISYALN